MKNTLILLFVWCMGMVGIGCQRANICEYPSPPIQQVYQRGAVAADHVLASQAGAMPLTRRWRLRLHSPWFDPNPVASVAAGLW